MRCYSNTRNAWQSPAVIRRTQRTPHALYACRRRLPSPTIKSTRLSPVECRKGLPGLCIQPNFAKDSDTCSSSVRKDYSEMIMKRRALRRCREHRRGGRSTTSSTPVAGETACCNDYGGGGSSTSPTTTMRNFAATDPPGDSIDQRSERLRLISASLPAVRRDHLTRSNSQTVFNYWYGLNCPHN